VRLDFHAHCPGVAALLELDDGDADDVDKPLDLGRDVHDLEAPAAQAAPPSLPWRARAQLAAACGCHRLEA
jgi:hypothetical protein